ncbi:flagellar hook-associated protein FlgL [Hydrogenimonas sp.]
MRITQNHFYNRFVTDQQSIKEQLDRLSQQLSSGMKIKYGYEDPQVFTDALRLDYEEHSLSQAVDVATDAQSFADNTDSVMFQFTDALTRFKTLLIQAANASNADNNYFALANELKSLKEHFIDLGNSSINGRYLFSGTMLDVKPLDDNGGYHGNGEELRAVVGSKVEVPYNIPGEGLFFGEDLNVNRVVTTNVALKRSGSSKPVDSQTVLGEITGSDNDYSFTIQGRRSDGSFFREIQTLSSDATVDDLLDRIEDAFGSDQVEVNLVNGYINVRDKRPGSSLLDFHLYGEEEGGEGTLEFVRTEGVAAHVYANDVPFEKMGENLFRGNMPQYLLDGGGVATRVTKIRETTRADLSGGVTFRIEANGEELSQTITIDDETTFQEMMDDRDSADTDSLREILENKGFTHVEVTLDAQGRMVVKADGLETFRLYEDKDASTVPKVLFNANDALTVDDPKHDFFAAVDEAIEAVENGLLYPDGKNGALGRNPGIENAIARIDHVIAHMGKEHTKIGAMSNSLKYAVERNETLKINVQTLRSDILDTDVGEASVKLSQLSLNFQALMASVAKIENLSLVNYL